MAERKKFLITGSYRPTDAYRSIRKNKYAEIGSRVTESQYLKIIKLVDQLLEQEFLEGNVIELPCKMGKVELRKDKVKVYITTNGKIRTNKPINWGETKKLWDKDKECLKSNILVYSEENTKPVVYYSTAKANFENKTFYQFRINRKIIQKAHIVINEGEKLIFDRR